MRKTPHEQSRPPIREEARCKFASNQEHMGDAMANLQLRQMHREVNAAILLERIPFDPGNIQNCGTQQARNRIAKNTCAQSGARGCRDGKSATQANASRSECGHSLERIPFDPGNIKNCGTRPARSRTAKNTRTPM